MKKILTFLSVFILSAIFSSEGKLIDFAMDGDYISTESNCYLTVIHCYKLDDGSNGCIMNLSELDDDYPRVDTHSHYFTSNSEVTVSRKNRIVIKDSGVSMSNMGIPYFRNLKATITNFNLEYSPFTTAPVLTHFDLAASEGTFGSNKIECKNLVPL